jgi:2-oxoglutarate ferredoxin oxidoreductase subunit delta
MSRIEIAAEMCKACELCIAVCPKNCIEQSDTLNRYGVYPMRMKDGAECTGCTLCATMCPDTAIEVYRTVIEKPAAENPQNQAETPVIGSRNDNVLPIAGG